MRVGILGASGQLGSKTLRAVVERGFAPRDVVGLARTKAKLADWADEGVEIRMADYDDPSILEKAFAGLDRVLLVPTMEAPGERVRQFDNAIAAARAAGVGHLLHFGFVPTSLASPFAATPFYVYAESALRVSGIDWTILRNGLYADPIADWVPSIVEMGTIPYPVGSGRCAYVSRDDIARAGAAALTGDGHEGKIYNLTGPRALSNAELCEIVARVTGKPVEDRKATDQDYLDACEKDGTPEPFARLLLSLYHAVRDGLLDKAPGAIEALTGTPPEDFETFLRRRLD